MAGKQRARNYRFLPKEMWKAGVNAVKGFKSIFKKRRGGRLKGLIHYRNQRVGTGLKGLIHYRWNNRVGTGIKFSSNLPQKERKRKSSIKSSKLGFEAIPEIRLRP